MINVGMKYSGTPWIGNIPNDWQQTKIRAFVKESSVKFKHLKNVEMIPLSLGAGKIYPRDLDENRLSDAAENYKLVEKNNLVIGIRAWQNSISVSELYGFVSPAYKVYKLNTNQIDPKYFKYYVNNISIVNHYITISQGICSDQWKVDDLKFRNLDFFMPNLPQQTAIANYLDHHTPKIDKELSLLEQKVEKLDEYKQSLIYETVTKGLDKNVLMKDSGIEWIGMIPKHWEVKRVKDVSKLFKGKANEMFSEPTNNMLPCIDTNFLRNRESSISYNNQGTKINPGKVLILWDGANAGELFLNQNYGYLGSTFGAFNTKINNKFWYYYLKGIEKNSRNNIIGMGIPHVNGNVLKQTLAIIPSKNEQQQISEYLDEQCLKIDKNKELINKKIELLKEYKQSLIYEAVTGKVEIK